MTFVQTGLFGVALAFMVSVPALAQLARPTDAELVAMLRNGGHVIVIRHGATHQDQADTDPLNPGNIAKQRQLNEKGRDAAKALGKAFKAIGITVGNVYTRQFKRAHETAELARFQNIEQSKDISEGGLVVSPNENNRRAAALRTLAGTLPAAGTNTIVVTHKPNILDAFGKDWFDVKEGDASIFRLDGTGYKLVARVQMDEWQKIAAVVRN